MRSSWLAFIGVLLAVGASLMLLLTPPMPSHDADHSRGERSTPWATPRSLGAAVRSPQPPCPDTGVEPEDLRPTRC